MSDDPVQREWVVREVVRRLRQRGATPDAPAPVAASAAPPPPAPAAVPPAGDLTLETRLVSLAALAGRLAGVRRVWVPAGAVVTPSVRDLLRKERVLLETLPPHEVTRVPASSLVTVRWTRTAAATQAAAALIRASGTAALAPATWTAAVQAVLATLAEPQGRAVLLTDEPLLAACGLNRAPVVRAAHVQDVAQLQAALAAICLNCLVLDPRTCAPPMWHQLLATYRDASSHTPPPRELSAARPIGG